MPTSLFVPRILVPILQVYFSPQKQYVSSMQSLNEPSTSGRKNPFRSVKSSMVCLVIVTWDNQPLEHGRIPSIDNISLARLVHLYQAQKQCVMQSYTSPTRKSLIRRLCFAASKNHPSTIPQNMLYHSTRRLAQPDSEAPAECLNTKGRVYGSSHVLCPLSFLDVRGTKESKGQQMTNVHKFSAC